MAQENADQSVPRAGMLARAVDWLFGYDFFVSYNHADGRHYPRRLRDRLEQSGFRVFLDQTDYVAGQDLRLETRRQVIKSRKIVVIGRPGALRSPWVKREIDVALAHQKVPIIIDIDRAVLEAPAGTPVADIARERHWLRINETLGDGEGEPSDQTVAELVRGFRHTRQETKRQRVFATAGVVLAVAAIVATWQAIEARRQQQIAERNFETAKGAADALVVDIARGLRDVEGMQTESVRRILARADTAFSKLFATAPDDPALLQSRIAMLNEFVETYLGIGDTAEASKAATSSVAASERLVSLLGGDRAARRQLALALLKLGDTAKELGKADEARTAYSRSLELRRGLVAHAPDDVVARREVAVALVRIGTLAESAGDLKTAKEFFAQSLAIRTELAGLRKEWRRDVVLAHVVLGDAQLGLGDDDAAAASFERAVALAEELLRGDPTSTKALRDLAIAQQRQGNLAIKLKDASRARSFYQASRTSFERLSRLDPGNIEWLRDISVSDAKLAKSEEVAGNLARSRELHEVVLRQRRDLLARSPSNSQLHTDLAEALKDLASLHPPQHARMWLAEARDILNALSRRSALGREQSEWLATIEAQIARTD